MPFSVLACRTIVIVLLSIHKTLAVSCSPGRPFPVPSYSSRSLQEAFNNISSALSTYFSDDAFNTTDVAIEVTSSKETLWSYYQAARDASSQDGSLLIGPETVFRVARVSKLFTAIAILQLHDQGLVKSLHNSILDYIPEIAPSKVSWERVSIWDLLNNVAGIVDMYGYADVFTDFTTEQKAALNLPPVSQHDLDRMPVCQSNRSKPCGATDFLSWVKSSSPVFDPHTINSNSNVGFALLGILIGRVSGMGYEQYIHQALIQPLGLRSTSFVPPDKVQGAVPLGDPTWGWDVGINKPSVGIYSSPRDISTLMRWALNAQVDSSLNWFAPGFYAVGASSLIGMPWNIFRTTSLLATSKRPVTFNTVVGTLGSYTSVAVVVPEYDLAFAFMMSGALGHPHGILANISSPLIRAADEIAWADVREQFAGEYQASEEKRNSSLTLQQSPERGLHITEWISNGSSLLPVMERLTSMKSGAGSHWTFQAVPSFKRPKYIMMGNRSFVEDEWRWTYVLDKSPAEGWDDWCLSSFDPVTYAGRPLSEMIFRKSLETNQIVSVTLSGYNITLKKVMPRSGISRETNEQHDTAEESQDISRKAMESYQLEL